MWRRFSRLQVDWAHDYRRVLSSSFRYSNGELVEIAQKLQEMTTEDIKRVGLQENCISDYLNEVAGRAQVLAGGELAALSQSLFSQPDLKELSLKAKIVWPRLGAGVSMRCKDMTYADLTNVAVILTQMDIKHHYVKRGHLSVLEELEKRELPENIGLLVSVLWAVTYKGQVTPMVGKVAKHVTGLDTKQVGLGVLAQVYSFCRRALPAREVDPLYERVAVEKMKQEMPMDDLIEALYFGTPYSLGAPSAPALLEQATATQLSHTLITPVQLSRLLNVYLFRPTRTAALMQQIQRHVQLCLADLSGKELVEAAIVCGRTAAVPHIEERLKMALAAPESLLTESIGLNLLQNLQLSGVKLPNIGSCIQKALLRKFLINQPSLGTTVRLASMMAQIGPRNEGLYRMLKERMWLLKSTAQDSDRDLVNSTVVLSECADIATEQSVLLAEELTFFVSYKFSWGSLAKSVYAFSRLNRGTPELFALLKKRLLEQAAPLSDQLLAAALFAFTQLNQPDFLQHYFPPAKRALLRLPLPFDPSAALIQESPKLNPQLRPYLHNPLRLPACSAVQLCWALAACHQVHELVSSTALLHSFDYHPQALFSLTPWYYQAVVVQNDETVATRLDTYHFGLMLNTLALVYGSTMSSAEAIEKARAKYRKVTQDGRLDGFRYPVDPVFRAEVQEVAGTQALSDQIDALGNTIDLLLPGKRAVLLLDKEDYVYSSKGYETQEGSEDLLRTITVKAEVLAMQDYEVKQLPRGLWRSMGKPERKAWLR